MEMTVAEQTVPSALQNADHNAHLVIYWDGLCPMCGAIKARFEPFDSRRLLVFVDLNDPEVARTAAPRFTSSELADSMRVRMPNGTWRSGYFAWAAILSALPAWRWLGAIMGFWVFADIGPRVYAWVAGHRYEISRVLGLPRPCRVDDACRIGAV